VSEKKFIGEVTKEGHIIIPPELYGVIGSTFDIYIDEEGRLILRPVSSH
jgi:bifunctional DNA-binding transcriptional regulator/antitoxin component of YhaV-PrlF toxin-antitoxin module